MVTAAFQLLDFILGLFKWAIILQVIYSWLTAFGVLDTRNRIVWMVGDFLYRVTDPVLRPVRNWLPNFGNVDLSPVVVIVVLWVVQGTLLPRIHAAIVYGDWMGVLL
jgi:YggT family protein